MSKHYNLLLSFFGLLFCCFNSSCNDKEDIIIPENDEAVESVVTYTITASPDLLKVASPQVSYVDENGNLVTLTGVEDLDGKVVESKAEENGVWISQVITGTGYKCWTLQLKFNRLDFHSYLKVKYLRNDFAEDTRDKVYDFHHDINSSILVVVPSPITYDKKTSTLHAPSPKTTYDAYTSITIGNYNAGDDIETYLENLSANPDKVGFYVDENGDVTRENDFEL